MSSKVFLINLDKSAERLSYMRQQAAKAGLAFERIAGVVGCNVPVWLSSEFVAGCLTPGEVGCYASHLTVAQQIVARGLTHAVVLEDDVELTPDFMTVVEEAIEAAPKGWDYIHLSSVFKKSIVVAADLASGHSLVRYTQWPANAAAYIVSNRGARKWLSPKTRVRPNDIENRYAWLQGLEVLGAYPAPAAQLNVFESVIGHFAGQHETRNWSPGAISMLYGLWWTGRRLGFANFVAGILMNLMNGALKHFDGVRRVAVIRPMSTGLPLIAISNLRQTRGLSLPQ
jgi:glycosyl transferase family 25